MSVPDYDNMPGPATKRGLTPLGFFRVGYDKNTGAAENGLADAQAFYPLADGIYTYLQGLFSAPGQPLATVPGTPLQLLITTTGIPPGPPGITYSAYWTSASGSYNIFLSPNANVNTLQSLLVSELSEIFMANQPGTGWYGGSRTEGEIGEGLSIYLTREWSLANGFNGYGQVGNQWMTTNPRANTLNTVDTAPDYKAKTALDVLFISYLHYQLNFSNQEIIAAGDSSHTLGAVYKNLTKDNNDPFPLFSRLLDSKWPAPKPFSAGVDQDCPWPLALVSITFQQNSFSKDDVNSYLQHAANPGLVTDCFSVDIDGFNLRSLNIGGNNTKNSLKLDPFADITDFPQDLSPTGTRYINTSNDIPQTVSYWYGIQFNSVADFPSTGGDSTLKLEADVTLLQKPYSSGSYSADPAFGNLVLYSGADPRFQNFTLISTSPPTNNQYYLSNDLRVFTFTPGISTAPPGLAFSDPYQYLRGFLNYLNTTYSTPAGGDPFTGALAAFPQSGQFSDDSSVTPYTYQNGQRYNNYNFGIARVRLDGVNNDQASDVKVFFRLWTANSPDTWFDTTNIYTTTTTTTASGSLDYPTPAPNDYTFPVFGTSKPTLADPANSEFGTTSTTPPVATGLNARDLTVPTGGELWAYYGCFFDLYSNPSPYPTNLLGGTHHCMVAQIDYSASPILNANGQWATPWTNNKLAQRNLSYTAGGNPVAQTQIIPQTFDIAPTAPVPTTAATALQRPDDLLIDWATVPAGSTANVYWPGINASDVIALANQWYSAHDISASDIHTLLMPITDAKQTYIPIPTSAGEKFAGLITINLPSTIVKGMEFQIVVQRITTALYTPRIIAIAEVPRLASNSQKVIHAAAEAPQQNTNGETYYWRQIVGSFSLHIPIVPHENLLPTEYDSLAILKWRLTQIPPTHRWYPVIERLIAATEGRIEGAGGDPAQVPPSPTGAPISVTAPGSGSGNKGCGCECCKKAPCHHHHAHGHGECGHGKGLECGKHHCPHEPKKHEKKCPKCDKGGEKDCHHHQSHYPCHGKPCDKHIEKEICNDCEKGGEKCTKHKGSEKEKCKDCEAGGGKCNKHDDNRCLPRRRRPDSSDGDETSPPRRRRPDPLVGKVSEIRYDCQGAFGGLGLRVECCEAEVRVDFCEICQIGLTGRIVDAFHSGNTVRIVLDEDERIEELGYIAREKVPHRDEVYVR